MKDGHSPPTYVIIDLGSSSFHLQAVQLLPAGPRPLLRIKRKVYLAAGLDVSNHLSAESIDKALACIGLFADQIRAFKADSIVVVGTAALRLAQNRQDFLKPAEKLLNTSIRILTGPEEADLIYQGVCASTLLSARHLVIDIGGASTELIYGEKHEPVQQHSFELGAVTLNTRFFPELKLHPDAYADAVTFAKSVFTEHKAHFTQHKGCQCVAASGIFSSIWELLSHGHLVQEVTASHLNTLRDKVLLYPSIQEIKLPGVCDARHTTLVSGLAILEALMQVFDIKTIQPAQGALREGVLVELTGSASAIDLQSILDALMRQFHLDSKHAQHVASYGYRVFQDIRSALNWRVDVQWHDLKTLLWLSELGRVFGEKNAYTHAAYFIEHSHIAGIDCRLKSRWVALFLLLSQHLDAKKIEPLPIPWTWIARLAGVIIAATRLRHEPSFPSLQWHIADDKLSIHFEPSWVQKHPLGFVYLEDEVIRQQRLGFDTQLLPISHRG